MPAVRIDSKHEVSEVAVFKHSDDNILDYNTALVEDIFKKVKTSSGIVLPEKMFYCDKVTDITLKFCGEITQYNSIRGLWLRLVGKEHSPFHDQCGFQHQIPIVYHDKKLYFFDFFNFFAKDQINCKTSVIVVSADEFCFSRILELTGSNLEQSYINKMTDNDSIDFPALAVLATNSQACIEFIDKLPNTHRSKNEHEDLKLSADLLKQNKTSGNRGYRFLLVDSSLKEAEINEKIVIFNDALSSVDDTRINEAFDNLCRACAEKRSLSLVGMGNRYSIDTHSAKNLISEISKNDALLRRLGVADISQLKARIMGALVQKPNNDMKTKLRQIKAPELPIEPMELRKEDSTHKFNQ